MSATAGQAVRRFVDGAPTANKWLSLCCVATVYLVLTSFWGGSAAIVHARPLFDEVLRLGYPPHFSTLLGVWKVLAAAAIGRPSTSAAQAMGVRRTVRRLLWGDGGLCVGRSRHRFVHRTSAGDGCPDPVMEPASAIAPAG